jgi:hypothetical protein
MRVCVCVCVSDSDHDNDSDSDSDSDSDNSGPNRLFFNRGGDLTVGVGVCADESQFWDLNQFCINQLVYLKIKLKS